jgi:ribosomal protein L27
MVRHQAPGQNIGVGSDVCFYLSEEKKIVFARKEDRLRIISPVENMVDVICGKLHGICFG